MTTDTIYDVIILGAGPAGLSAGIYASRGKMNTLILNEGATGGQVTLTDEIANYPGVENQKGYELIEVMKRQAKSFGCAIKSNLKVTGYHFSDDIKTVEVNGKDRYHSKTVIVASGGKPRMLDVPGEREYKGAGVSYCATCDGDFFTGKELVVVGGGNSALEEAVALTRYASKVTIVHQFDHFQAFGQAIEDVRNHPRIRLIMSSQLKEIGGSDVVERVVVQNMVTGEITEISTNGVFVFIGYVPNTDAMKGILTMNTNGEILVDKEMRTNIPGVFAAGDAVQKRFRQVTTAVADGTIAALSAMEFVHQYKAIYPYELINQ